MLIPFTPTLIKKHNQLNQLRRTFLAWKHHGLIIRGDYLLIEMKIVEN